MLFSPVKLFKIYFYAISCFCEMLKIYAARQGLQIFNPCCLFGFVVVTADLFLCIGLPVCVQSMFAMSVLQNNMCLGIKCLCYVTRPCLFQPEDGAAEPSAALEHEQTLVRISFILFHPVNLNITPTQYTEKNNLIPYLYCALKKNHCISFSL